MKIIIKINALLDSFDKRVVKEQFKACKESLKNYYLSILNLFSKSDEDLSVADFVKLKTSIAAFYKSMIDYLKERNVSTDDIDNLKKKMFLPYEKFSKINVTDLYHLVRLKIISKNVNNF